MNKKNAFIGPLPPPLGDVAAINKSFQALDYPSYNVYFFNTSNGEDREDLYSKNSINIEFLEYNIFFN